MKWEYKTVKLGTAGFLSGKVDEVRLDRLMNELGDQGWELVLGLDTNEIYGKSNEVAIPRRWTSRAPVMW